MTEGTAGIRLSRIGQIALTVDDLEGATAFYRDVLGMELLFSVSGMSFFKCGDIRLMLGTPQGPDDHPSSIIYYKVDDIQAAYETLMGRGVQFEQAPLLVHKAEDHELWLAFFYDVHRNMLALMAEKPLE